jgi:hypothetical protein
MSRVVVWLELLISETENVYIKYEKKGQEVKCGKYSLDSLCEQNKTIYEFHG